MVSKHGHTDVAVFLPHLNGGGAERVLLTVAQVLARRGFNVDLVLATAVGPYLKEVQEPLRLIDLRAARVLAALPPLIRYLKKNRPFALLTGMGRCNLVALWARSMSRVPTRICISEHSPFSVAVANTSSLRTRTRPWLATWWYPKADGIVTVSSGVAEDLSNTLGLERARIEVIYNPVVSKRLVDMSQEAVDHTWFLPEQTPVVLAVGRLSKEKDFSTLIRAFSILRGQRKARLLILGEGEERPALQQLSQDLGVADDVALQGFMDNPFAYMRRASVFVLSSRWEGFGNVLAEAMACGTPVISTNCPNGPSEILEGGKWGRLVPVADAEALASAILATLDEPKHPDVQHRAQDFSVDTIIDQYLPVLGVTA